MGTRVPVTGIAYSIWMTAMSIFGCPRQSQTVPDALLWLLCARNSRSKKCLAPNAQRTSSLAGTGSYILWVLVLFVVEIENRVDRTVPVYTRKYFVIFGFICCWNRKSSRQDRFGTRKGVVFAAWALCFRYAPGLLQPTQTGCIPVLGDVLVLGCTRVHCVPGPIQNYDYCIKRSVLVPVSIATPVDVQSCFCQYSSTSLWCASTHEYVDYT